MGRLAGTGLLKPFGHSDCFQLSERISSCPLSVERWLPNDLLESVQVDGLHEMVIYPRLLGACAVFPPAESRRGDQQSH